MTDRPRPASASQVPPPTGPPHPPIAIVGIGCRFPRANGPGAFWRLLTGATDAIREIPPERFDLQQFFDPEPAVPGKTYSRWGGFIDDITGFDAEFFGISPREAERMDPQQRLLLEVAWEALEDAGTPPQALAGTTTGMFLGQIAANYWDLQTRATPPDIYSMVGSGARAVLSGRISYALDLRGPCISIDTACSSSLVAVHLACQSLRTGESQVAVAGGVNIVLLPDESITYSQARMLAPDGRCKFADASADGFVRSDGVGLVVLKPLERALADGDRIYASIAGNATNNDGQGSGYLMTPSEDGQAMLLHAALADAGIDGADLDYVEAHGTGTSVGDGVELRALASVVAAGRPESRPCLVGSVKTNIGHAEGAAGIAGLIKTALSLHHGSIPPTLHVTEPSPALDWRASGLAVVTRQSPWPDRGRPAVAGVSSFGISGSNAHAVLVQASPATALAQPPEPPVAPRLVLPISARSPEALAALAEAFAERVEACSTHAEAAALCAAAACRRTHHGHRLAVAGDDGAELAAALRGLRDAPAEPRDPEAGPPRVAFVFPGQGSQWAGMGRELLASSQAFRAAVEACDRAIAAEAGWSLRAVLEGDATDRLDELDVLQPALWAMQTCLAGLWRSWGVEPDVVIGHSMGEVAAAHVSEALDVTGAAAVICRRSRLARTCAGAGAMAVVELPAQEAALAVAGREALVCVAAHNSPSSTVLSGDSATMTGLLAELEGRGVACRLVRVDFASHSPQMDRIRAELVASLEDLESAAPRIAFHSTVLDRGVSGVELNAAYWADNIRRPVLFAEAVRAVAADGPTIFLEVSPHPIITSAVNATLAAAGLPGCGVGSLMRDQPERAALLDTLAELYTRGVDVDWSAVWPGIASHVDMPCYPWQHEPYWFAPGEGWPKLDDRPQAPPPSARHPLLGDAVAAGDSLRWEGTLDRDANAYLDEHRVQGEVILPGTAYLELVHAAACEAMGDVPITLSEVRYETALFLAPSECPQIAVALDPAGDGAMRFSVHSRRRDEAWQPHAAGTVRPGARSDGHRDVDAIRTRCVERIDGSAFYAAHERRGNHWGGAFRALRELWRRDGEALATLRAPAELNGSLALHRFHPALLDACGQSLAATLPDKAGAMPGDDVFVLGAIDEVRFHATPPRELVSHATMRPGGRQDSLTGDVHIADANGRPVADMIGLRLQYLDPTRTRHVGAARDAPPADGPEGAPVLEPAPTPAGGSWLYELAWERCPVTASAGADLTRWLLLAASENDAEPLRGRLRGRAAVAWWGSRFQRRGPGRFEFDPSDAGGYARLLAAATAELPGSGPLRVVDMAFARAGETGAAERRCLTLAHVVRAAVLGGSQDPTAGTRLGVISRAAQRVVTGEAAAPEEAAVWGLGRVLAREHQQLGCVLVDLPANPSEGDLDALAAHLVCGDGEDQVAVRGGERLAARLVPFADPGRGRVPSVAASAPAAPRVVADVTELHVSDAGSLDDIALRPSRRRRPGPGEVEIEVAAVALNFRDVLLALGVYPGQQDGLPSLGWECAGCVAAVGSGVAGISAGDEVLALAHPAFRSHVVTHAELVVPRPAQLSAEEAVTIPIAYLTAYHGLCELARLRPGERVLVHSATGGVGLAAIRIAQWKGAEVLGTAGSPQKRALLGLMGVRHVCDSRSTGFVDEFRAATGGRGVDVILNTLAGDAARANWELLSPYGRYVELAKRDIVESGALALEPFARNLSFHAVDVADMVVTRPERAGALLHTIVDLVRRGDLGPLPFSSHRAGRATDAFHELAEARQIGKVVLTFDSVRAAARAPAPALRAAEPSRAAPAVRDDASYLVTGGLGDLGRVVTSWLVDRGAKHLVLVGRTALGPQDGDASRGDANGAGPAALRAWRARGVEVDYHALDVADEAALSAALARRRDAGLPEVRGVVHAAGVIRYQSVMDLDARGLAEVLRPKVAGARCLDRVLGDAPLDFFVLFSSGSAVLSSPMLGAYAAANAAMDAVAHGRRARGLTALTVNWGFWGSVGMAARFEHEQGRPLAPHGMASFSPAEGIGVLERLIGVDAGQVVVMRADWATWAASYPDAASVPILRRLCAAHVVGAAPAPAPPRAPAPPPAPAPAVHAPAPDPVPAQPPAAAPAASDDVESYVAERVAAVLRKPVARLPRRQPLNRLGLDSLMAVEVRNHILRDLGVNIPVVKLLGGNSLADLAAEVGRVAAREAGETAELQAGYEVVEL